MEFTFRYEFTKQNEEIFNKKFDESVRKLQTLDFEEMLTHEHPEPQPIERHNFCFL
jgi:hypothetical protein